MSDLLVAFNLTCFSTWEVVQLLLICLQGDIGGPLIAADPKSPEHNQALIGVVRNTRGCPSLTPDFPEVYTKVSAFLDWIKANMNAWIFITCRFNNWNINVALKLLVLINKCTSSSQKKPFVLGRKRDQEHGYRVKIQGNSGGGCICIWRGWNFFDCLEGLTLYAFKGEERN